MVNLFGYYMSFAVQRHNARQCMKQAMRLQKMKNTTQFVFTADEYRQLKKYDGGKEFSLNGGMYDVVRTLVDGERVIVTAYYDKRETGVIDSFLAFFDEGAPLKNVPSLRQFSLQEFVFFTTGWQICLSYQAISLPVYISSSPLAVFVSLATPPPDFLTA
ncbi:MAG TPA: hypothetical protein VK154_20845 [Chitinophagales bacterium]|nr:hypothetical protein [Chitinophagales bacterium]